MDWEAISALATVAAVVIALFLDPYRTWRNKPKLRIRLRERDCTRSTSKHLYQGDPYIELRLFVRNAGRETAEDVQVTVTDVYEVWSNGRLRPHDFVQTSLVWTDTSDTVLPRVPTQIGKLCNFGTYIEHATEGHRFALGIGDRAKLNYDTFEPEPEYTFILRLVASGSNCASVVENFAVGLGRHEGYRRERLLFSMHQGLPWETRKKLNAIVKLLASGGSTWIERKE